jgi:hypothetical protein
MGERCDSRCGELRGQAEVAITVEEAEEEEEGEEEEGAGALPRWMRDSDDAERSEGGTESRL